ncbi:MAG TPA: hypothetical protein VFV33_23965 [Gemmatimonadaceae bacterium]|nr:hypothetical protein [Gemmatimonadaceae bacterium]
MTRRSTLLLALAALLLAPLPALHAQVGYTPEASPFRDLEHRHEWTGAAGWYFAQKDRLGIAPRSGPMVTGRYAFHVGGPVYLAGELGSVFTDRRVLDPSRPAGSRIITEESTRLYLFDASVAVALTGHRSWHHLVPEVNAGVGLVASHRRGLDVGGYEFGAPFALSLGTGIRWVPGGRWALRGDLRSRMYKITYPTTYFQTASDSTSALRQGDSRSGWTFNPGVTLGISYLMGR